MGEEQSLTDCSNRVTLFRQPPSVTCVTGKWSGELDTAIELERIALEDDYFVSRKLYPNVDFYSGIIYQATRLAHSRHR